MTRPFTHLHVASGYSLRYGASSPGQLVETAVAQGMQSLALTDRDGLYGAVKFALACGAAKVTPLLGVDLAVESSGLTDGLPDWAVPGRAGRPGPTGPTGQTVRRAPVRGGASVDPRHPRVTVLALGQDQVTGLRRGQGWAQLCRLVTATQLRGERGRPVSTFDLVTAHAQVEGAAALVVLLGPDSEFGRAVLAKRPDLARAVLRRWREALPVDALVIEIVHHRSPEGRPGSRGQAARMLNLAREAGVPAVLSNAVRHATRDGAVTVDVLDSARRLVALDTRHLDRTTAEGYLAGPDEMRDRAIEVAEAAGDPDAARSLLGQTEILADRCRLDVHRELGFWQSHLPEHHVLGLEEGQDADAELRRRCEEQLNERYPHADRAELRKIEARLDAELTTVTLMGVPTYFLTIASVCKLIRDLGVRVAARGSGAGSLINYLLGISGVDPLRYGLLMERFVTPLRIHLPDVDLDVESDRRTDVYEKVLETFGADRVTCVSMMDTYRVRHAVRDVGAALGLPPSETDLIAKSFPHIRARDARQAIADLPELRASGLGEARLDLFFELVERLDGLPRHVALHPCGVIISDVSLLDRTPVEASWQGFPMSQFDKDDVEVLGLLKLDLLGIRMQSAMSYAIKEIARVDGPQTRQAGGHPEEAGYLDAAGRIELDRVPLDDETTFALIRTTRTLGCFQIESPGQRELIGKFGPETFLDLIIDISLFRPGPVKSDMINPFLRVRKGFEQPSYLHSRLKSVLESTCGVVVFHEQVLQIVATTTGCSLAQADEVRRAMGSTAGQLKVEDWFRRRARGQEFDDDEIQRIWEVLKAFASFGFCKAHAAAFALPTYQSAWLKAHHPAAFLAGVLTHDPGMYPKRLILDDARNFGIEVLPLDVNRSDDAYRVERLDSARAVDPDGPAGREVDGGEPGGGELDGGAAGDSGEAGGWGEVNPGYGDPDLPDGRPYGIRLSLAEVKGASTAEVARVVANRPYHSLADFWHRARVSRPMVERLIVAGAFDSIYGLTEALPVQSRGQITRRDLLLQLGDLERWTRSTEGRAAPRGRGARGAVGPGGGNGRGAAGAGGRHGAALGGAGGRGAGAGGRGGAGLRGAGARGGAGGGAGAGRGNGGAWGAGARGAGAGHGDAWSGAADGGGAGTLVMAQGGELEDLDSSGVRWAAARQSQGARVIVPAERQPVQLAFDLGDAPDQIVLSGLPEMTGAERVRAELEVLGLDASRHVLDFYAPMLAELEVTRTRDVQGRRNRAELLVAGVKVATQTPPIRTGRRVVFLTLDDSTGPIDATFFEDAQGPYAGTVFHSWLLVVRGVLRKTGARGISLRATGAWELPMLWDVWTRSGVAGVHEVLQAEGELPERTGRRRPAIAGLPAASFHGGIVPADPGVAAPGRVTGTERDDGALPGAEAPDWEAASGLPSGDRRRVLVHPSGYRQSPYADLKTPGDDPKETRRMLPADGVAGREEELRRREPPRKLWHASPGSSGR
jgi:error-prone DNA polymerase